VVAVLSPDAKQSTWLARELSFIDASRDYLTALKELSAALSNQSLKNIK